MRLGRKKSAPRIIRETLKIPSCSRKNFPTPALSGSGYGYKALSRFISAGTIQLPRQLVLNIPVLKQTVKGIGVLFGDLSGAALIKLDISTQSPD
jgi:hypothetical protein